MDVTLGTVLAATVPTIAIALVGFMLKKRWDAVDVALERMEQKIEGVRDKVERNTQALHKRITDAEKDLARVDERVNMHLKGGAD